MKAALLALALTTCIENPDQCQTIEAQRGTLITACGLAPNREGDTFSIQARINRRFYTFVLDPKCVSI